MKLKQGEQTHPKYGVYHYEREGGHLVRGVEVEGGVRVKYQYACSSPIRRFIWQ